MEEKKVKISGMTCVACASGIERNVKKLDRVKDVHVNFANKTATIIYEKGLEFSEIIQKIEELDFKVVKDNDDINLHDNLKIKLIITSICTIPLFYIAMAPMIKVINLPFAGMILSHVKEFSIIQFLLCIIVMIVGYKFYVVGYKSLLKKVPNMDSLIAISTTASFIYSTYSFLYVLSGKLHFAHHLYFESIAVIVTLVMLGKFLEEKSKCKTSDAIKKLIELTPKIATLIKDGKEVEVNTNDILIGDIVVVKNGNKIPLDGKIIKGNASINEAMITGESLPIEKGLGDSVIGGTINENGYIQVEITTIGKDTVLSQIIKLVEDAQGSKAKIAKIADVVSGYFVVVVLILAVITSLVWFAFGKDIEFCLTIFVSILTIACPCALGLATPISIIMGTGKGANKGILYKDAVAIETLSKVNMVVFDKTGTLTRGEPKVTDIYSDNISSEELLKIAASSEKLSEHPLSKAIVGEAKVKKISFYDIQNFENIVGRGIKCILNKEEIYIGNAKLMQEFKIDISKYNEKVSHFAKDGKTSILISKNKEAIGIIAISDTIKENSKELINKLHSMDINTYMITGDNENTARHIANQVGITNIVFEALPKDKNQRIQELKDDGYIVAMVGDGINDAPSLASANVGIAINSGTDIAIESADVVLMKNDIFDVYHAINICKYTMKVIKQNLFWAFAYNILGIPVAMGILYIFGGPLLNPMIAALAMAFSSVCVVLNALKIGNIK